MANKTLLLLLLLLWSSSSLLLVLWFVCFHSIDPYPTFLHNYAANNKWEDCLRLCRFVEKKFMWACLAAMGLQAKEIDTATAAYASLGNVSCCVQ